jgi:uncharacterized membrane protein
MALLQALPFLPEGFGLPPLPHTVGLVVAALLVAVWFRRQRPTVMESHILALVPWMVFGAALHVLFVTDQVAGPIRPFFGTPAVYVSVAVVAGLVWLILDTTSLPVPIVLGADGVALALASVALVLGTGASDGRVDLLIPALGVAAAAVTGVVAWFGLKLVFSEARATAPIGPVVLFAHALDGVSTAIGVDLLGAGERSPVSRAILEFAAGLPTAETIGAGWLFVLVKLLVAGVVVAMFTEYVRSDPAEGNALLGLVMAVGLGPGTHNLLLFAVSGLG